MFWSCWGERHCFLDIVLKDVTFELGFETHRGLAGRWELYGLGKGLLPGDCKSRAVWASSVHWLALVPSAMVKNNQIWLRVKTSAQEPVSCLAPLSLRCQMKRCCEEAVGAERKVELGWMDHPGQFIFLRSQRPLGIHDSY